MKTIMSRVAGKIFNHERHEKHPPAPRLRRAGERGGAAASSSACRTVLPRRFFLPWTCQTALERRSTTKNQEQGTFFPRPRARNAQMPGLTQLGRTA